MSDIPPRVIPADFDALEAAARRCEEALLRTAETRKRLKLDETAEVSSLRAEIRELRKRVRLARREALGQNASRALYDLLDLRRPLPKGRR